MKELVDYFIAETDKKYERLERKVDQLLEFKWKIIGGSVGLSVFITVLFQIGMIILNK
jgi:hypothetical protein